MDLTAAKGQIPDKAIADLLLLSQRPDFKKLLYVPQVNWVLVISCAVALVAWAYLGNLWLEGGLHSVWLFLLSTYTFFIFLLTAHEGSHLTLSRNRKLNDVLATILTIVPLPQMPVVQFRHQHLTHHRDTCGEEDPDDYLYQGPFLVRMFKVFTHDFYWAYWSFTHRDSAAKSTQWMNVSGVAIYLMILAVGLTSPYWYEFLMLYVIPQRIGIFVAIYMFAYVQHPPEKCSVKERSPFKTTAIIRGVDNAFAKVYFGQNRHLMHHLYPNMPIYRNWKAWQLGKDIFEQQALVNIGLNAEHFNNVSEHNERDQAAQKQFLNAEIISVDDIAEGIKAYTFVPETKCESFPTFKAGAHIDVVVTPDLIRQYSLCNSSDQKNAYTIAVQCENDGRGGSKTVHDTFKRGDKIKISKPRNLFELKDAPEVMLFAGGIGITPMLAMAWTLHRKNIPFELHYCTATGGKWAFKDIWQDLPFVNSTHVYLDDDDASNFNAKAVFKGHEKADIYVCGPGGFMDYIEKTVFECGYSPEQFNKESFKAGAKLGEEDNKPFTLKLAKSGKSFIVPEDKSVVEVLKENDIFIPISCENGVCGTCKCKVTSGEVEHRDMVLSDGEKEDQKLFTPCVSRASSDVLEIAGY